MQRRTHEKIAVPITVDVARRRNAPPERRALCFSLKHAKHRASPSVIHVDLVEERRARGHVGSPVAVEVSRSLDTDAELTARFTSRAPEHRAGLAGIDVDLAGVLPCFAVRRR